MKQDNVLFLSYNMNRTNAHTICTCVIFLPGVGFGLNVYVFPGIVVTKLPCAILRFQYLRYMREA